MMFRQFWTATALLMLSALPSGTTMAATPEVQLIALCDGKFGLCGYVDRKTRKEMIPARFERAMPFSDGLAAVRIGGRFGYIDARGEIVIEPKFDLAGEFKQGLAEILIGDKTGVINRAGDIVVPPMFARAIPFTKDVIIAKEGTWSRQHYEGSEALLGLEGVSLIPDSAGLYHVGGHWIYPPTLSQIKLFTRDGRGLIWATTGGHREAFGLLGGDGQWVVLPQFDYAAAATDGRSIVRKKVDGVMLAGAVDATGRLVVPLRAWSLSYWHDGWGIARENGKEGLIDIDGNLIGGRFFDKVQRGEPDIATVLIDGEWKGLDRAGNIVPHPLNGKAYASCPGFNVVHINGKMQITDVNGQPTTSYQFAPLTQRPSCEKPFPVSLDGKWSFVGLDGRLLRDPADFDNAYGFAHGYAAVKQGSKWGLIDESGRFSMAPKFDELAPVGAGLYRAVMAGQTLWITQTGEERPAPSAKPVVPAERLDCRDGLKLAQRDNKWGIADHDGRFVIAPQYRAIVCFKNGIAWAPIEDRRQWCAIGPDGALREKPACKTEHYSFQISHYFPERLHPDPFESSVLWEQAEVEFKAGQRPASPRMIGDGTRGHGVWSR